MSAPFLFITGGKGGVGKSTLAANLAVHLTEAGRRVLLVDLDLGLADLGVFLRLPAGPTIEDALEGRATLSECVVTGPGGVHVLPASSGSLRMGRPDEARCRRLLRELKELSRDYEVVLGDGAAGIGPDSLAFAAAADHVWVVTTPEPAAMTDAYGLIKALHGYGIESGAEVPTPEVVVNQAAGLEQARAGALKLRRVCEEFLSRSPRQGGWMPRSRVVAECAAKRRPFALERGAALEGECLARLAARLGRFLEPAPQGVPA